MYVEYLSNDIAARESINALYLLPAWTVMVGQSVMCATVITSVLGGPPHLWGALLREGSLSLNPHLTHWKVHQSCNKLGGESLIVACLCFLSLVFQAVLLKLWEGLEDVMQVFLCNVPCLDLLQSWQCEENLLCDEDLLCGISH